MVVRKHADPRTPAHGQLESGCRSTIAGTLLCALILGTLNNGLTLMNIDPFWQDVARGILLLADVGFDQLRQRLSDK